MKFTAKASALVAALEPCVRVVASKQVIPVLANVLIEASKEAVKFTCSNLDQTACAQSVADIESPGKITVPAARLLGVLKNISPDAACSVVLDNDLTIKSGRSRATLRTLPAEDFPELKPEFTASLQLAPAEIIAAFGAVAYAASTEETRYYLCGVHMVSTRGIDFVATDGHRLALFNFGTEAPEFRSIIIPSEAVKQFMSLASAAKESEQATLDISEQLVRLSFASGAWLTTRTIDGTFPRYQAISDVPVNDIATVDRRALIQAVNMAASACDVRSSIAIELTEGLCSIRGRAKDEGDAQAEIDAEVSTAHEFFINHNYLSATLSALTGNRVRIAFNEAKTAAHFFGDVSSGQAVIMPTEF